MRPVIAFLFGFIAGMLFLVVLLWSHGTLPPVRAASSAPGIAPLPASPAIASPTIASPSAPTEARPGLVVPVMGVRPSQINDSFADSRGGSRHGAVDIMAPRGTPVLAVEDGAVEKLFHSARGGT